MLTPQYAHFDLTPLHPSRKHFGYTLAEPAPWPVVSIVTPFYNTREVFHQTAQNILNQSLQQFEWLIINDGSTDSLSLNTLNHYRHFDPRIRVIDHPHNLGVSAARNTGFAEARCEYVLLLDSDDLLEPTAAEKWWWFLQTHPQFGFVASYHVAFGEKEFLWTGGFHEGALNAERNRVSMLCLVRKSVHEAVGGFDEGSRGGLEDWEFWMRCAAQGYWGATVPEFLAWYRVRAEHSDRWENLGEERLKEFRNHLQQRYPQLYQGQFPNPPLELADLDLTQVTLDFPAVNRLQKTRPRLLLILPWLVMGGAERFALNLMDQLQQRGWQMTVVATAPSEHPWLHEFARRSEDVFLLPNFLPIKDYPRFLGYLITSRQIDAVLLQGSLEGYRLLPVLRGLFPDLPILDYLQFVTPDWMDGGLPRLSVLYHDCIDLTVTSCHQVRQWMLEQGAEAERLRVCPINVDAERWRPDASAREQVRAALGIPAEAVVILYAARLEPQKQPEVFAETLNILNKEGVAFYALVAGDGSLRPVLEARLRAASLVGRVHLLGAVESERMPAVMAAADILFLPSQNEGIAQALYEGMACGLVPVGARVGGQDELVTPECGVLLPMRQDDEASSAYAAVLRDLIQDAERRQQMSVASRARILEHFTLEQMGACMDQVISEVKSSRSSHPGFAQVLLLRQAREIVEYLQARQAAKEKIGQLEQMRQQYLPFVPPKPPSHWFYLWLRQLFLSLFGTPKNSGGGRLVIRLKEWLKEFLFKSA